MIDKGAWIVAFDVLRAVLVGFLVLIAMLAAWDAHHDAVFGRATLAVLWIVTLGAGLALGRLVWS